MDFSVNIKTELERLFFEYKQHHASGQGGGAWQRRLTFDNKMVFIERTYILPNGNYM